MKFCIQYISFQQKVNERTSALEDALGQVSSLRDQLDGLLGKLLKMKSGLKGHEPPHVIPADVEKQIKELMVRMRGLFVCCLFCFVCLLFVCPFVYQQ